MMFRSAISLFFVFVLALAAGPAPGRAQPLSAGLKSPQELDLSDVGTVKEIRRSDMIVLDDGVTYRLDQIRVPPAYEAAAADYLRKNLLGQTVGIYTPKKMRRETTDRDNNKYAHVLRQDGKWMQADIVAQGLAWAYSTDASRLLVQALFPYEDTARQIGNGFWADKEYGIKDKTNISRHLNSYQLFEGKIKRVDQTADGYNFLCDLDNDMRMSLVFTITHNRTSLFTRPGATAFSLSEWSGDRVRLRGWVEKRGNVPAMEITHPEQILFLEKDAG